MPDRQAVRTGQWKYIHYPARDGMGELYDVAADPIAADGPLGAS